MAVPTATRASQRTLQVVGAAFVQQYYYVLHKIPEMVHKFYQDCSILSRPDSGGEMSQVTTLKAINDEVLSFKFNSYIAEIETVDSVASYKEGVFIVVTGCLTASDDVRRKFTQSFFLAPQDKNGYFVLTDIFRFVDQSQPMELDHSLANGENGDASKASPTVAPEPSLVEENHGEDIATPALVLPVCQNQSNDQPNRRTTAPGVQDNPNCKTTVSVVQDNAPKKSYASIIDDFCYGFVEF